MSIQTPTKESQEAMQAKTQAIPPRNVGDSLPEGGTVGQVLTKTATGSEWADVPEELPEGGSAGQVLKKTAEGTAWGNIPEELPDYSQETAGKVLTIVEGEGGDENELSWEEVLPSYAGETPGKVLTVVEGATSEDPNEVSWETPEDPLPAGGTAGQVLTKTASGSEWADAPGGFSYKRLSIVYNGTTPIKDMTSFTDITSNCTIDTTFLYGTTGGGFSGEAYPYAMKIGSFIGSVIARRSPESSYDTRCYLTGILKDSTYGNGDGILTFMLASTIVKTETGNRPTIDKLWVKYEPYTPST